MQSRWLVFAVFLSAIALLPFASALTLLDGVTHAWHFDQNSTDFADSMSGSDVNISYVLAKSLNGAYFNGLAYIGLGSQSIPYDYNASNTSNSNTKSYSYNVWIYYNDSSNSQGLYSTDAVGTVRLMLNNQSTSSVSTYRWTNAGLFRVTATGLVTGNWYMFTTIYDSATLTLKLYVNGVLSGSVFSDGQTNGLGSGIIGGYKTPFYGIADEFVIWDRALDDGNVSYLYNVGSPTFNQTYPYPFIALNPPSIIRPSNPIVNYTENIEFWSDLSEGTGVPDNLVAPGSVTASLVNTTWDASVKPAAFSNSLLIGTQSGDIGLVMNATRFDDWNDDFSMRGVCFWVRKTGSQENGWFQYKNATKNATYFGALATANVIARWTNTTTYAGGNTEFQMQSLNTWYHDCVMLNLFEGGYSVTNDTMEGVGFNWLNGVYNEGGNFGDYDGASDNRSMQWSTNPRPAGLQTPSGTMAFGSANGYVNGVNKYIAQPIVFNFKHGFTPTNFNDQVNCLYNGGSGRNYSDFINTCRLFNIKNVTLNYNGSALVGNYFLISAKGTTDQSTYRWFVNGSEVVGETNHYLSDSKWTTNDVVTFEITPATEAETGDVMNVSYPLAIYGFNGLTNLTEISSGVFEGYLPSSYQSVAVQGITVNSSVPNIEQTIAYWNVYRTPGSSYTWSSFFITRDFNGLWYNQAGGTPFGYYNKTNTPSPPPYNYNSGSEILLYPISSILADVYLRDTLTNTIVKKTLIIRPDPSTVATYPIINSSMYGYKTTGSVNVFTGDDLVWLSGANYVAMPLTHSWGYLISPERVGSAGTTGGATHGVLMGTVGNITGASCISVDQECLYFSGAGNMSVGGVLQPSGTYSAWGPNMFVTWVYPTNDSATTNQTIISNTGTNAGYFWLRLNGLTPEFRAHNDAFIVSNVSLPLNQWSLLAATYNGAVRSIYVNGQMTANGSGTVVSGTASTRPVIVGSQASGVNPFYGYIDEFYFFPARGTSHAQPNVNSMLARIYNNGTGNFLMNGFGYEKISPTNAGSLNYSAAAIISSIKMIPGQLTGASPSKVRLAGFPMRIQTIGGVSLISGTQSNAVAPSLINYNAEACAARGPNHYNFTLLGIVRFNASNDVTCAADMWANNNTFGFFENPCNVLSNGTQQCSEAKPVYFQFVAPTVSFTTSMNSVCQQLVYPNEKDLPTPQQIQYNFTVDVTPSYDAESYVTYIQRAGQAAITPVCSYLGAGLQRNYTCNATMNYYTKPGLYTIYVNFTNGGLSTAHQNSDVCSYGQLLAMQKTTPGLTFAGARPGTNNIRSSNVITLENTGNVDFTMFLTGKDLTGRTSPSEKLPASAFKVGVDNISWVPLSNGVPINTSILVSAGFRSNESVYLWLSMNSSQLPQDYYSQDSWEISGQS